MKTVEEIAEELEALYRTGTHKAFRHKLKEWTGDIIDECGIQALAGWTDAPVRDESETIAEYIEKVKEKL